MWTCPTCGFAIRSDVIIYPVHCVCDAVFPDPEIEVPCPHRSAPIGQLKRGCSRCQVYRCNKYGTYCTLTTPAEYNLPLLVDGSAGERLTRENSRACSLCRAAGEDV